MAIATTCVVTELSYRFIETPIRKGSLGRWWKQLRASSDPVPRRRASPPAAAAVTAVAVFAAASLATAELRPNEIAAASEEGREATVDLEDIADGDVPIPSTRPTTDVATVPSTTEAPATTEAPTTSAAATTAGETTVPADDHRRPRHHAGARDDVATDHRHPSPPRRPDRSTPSATR